MNLFVRANHFTAFNVRTLPDLCSAAVTVVSPRMGENGWPFGNVDSLPGADADPVIGASHVKDLYLKADSEFSGR